MAVQMKSCPSCLTQYTDDTLMYCLQDGTPLITAAQSDLPTVVIGETDTLVNPRSRARNLDTKPDISSSGKVDRPRSYTAVAVVTTVLVMLIVFGLLGFGTFLYFRNKTRLQTTNANSTISKSNQENRNTASSPTPTRVENRPSNPPQPGNRATSEAVNDETRDEIRRQIDSWREATEEMDLDSLMDHYAPKVEYYNKRGADPGFIRADKERAFARFDDISMNISNLEVTPADTDDRLSVVFDKEWRFRGERTSTGKVRQLLQLKKINGTWLITSERDLKVY